MCKTAAAAIAQWVKRHQRYKFLQIHTDTLAPAVPVTDVRGVGSADKFRYNCDRPTVVYRPRILRMLDLFDDLPLNLRNQMYFMHDGAPPHFARVVREYLNEQFTGRWIGRGNDAPISWPPCSPDLNPCDFFIWGDLKQRVYSVSIENEEQLWDIIQNAVQELQNEETLRRVHFNFLRRIEFCSNENGDHFEHLIKSQ
ncbi:hypothetical protein NQ318_021086 [Aromia moschata]|uniref:Transposase n=1 Tax=Aromia moschata TaxID=1265417 RepID=A0AAV8XU80_9CUCU|nr:hypothetical protein NQ318_021086 [Aromia moschata]